MAKRDVVVVAASAGGIEALRDVLQGLPSDFPAAVLVVVHMGVVGGEALPRVLQRASSLPVASARDGELLRPGRVYVCIGDHHLLVADGHLHLRRGPRENGLRPAADPLFRSAARYYGPRVIGLVLSGALSDGTAGLFAVKQHGGIAVVQDPADALFDGMPSSALHYVEVDHVAPSRAIGPLLVELAGQEVEVGAEAAADDPPDPMVDEVPSVEEQSDAVFGGDHPAVPSPWPCPDCQGVLWAVEAGPAVRFRCRVGHAWWPESLAAKQEEAIESALWMALRALEDKAALSTSMAGRAEAAGRDLLAARARSDLEGLDESIEAVRALLKQKPDRGETGGVTGDV